MLSKSLEHDPSEGGTEIIFQGTIPKKGASATVNSLTNNSGGGVGPSGGNSSGMAKVQGRRPVAGSKKDQKVVTNIITNNNINTFIINDPTIAANTAGNPAAAL